MKRLSFAAAALVAATIFVSCSPNTTPKSDAPRANQVPANESVSTAPVDDAAASAAPVATPGPGADSSLAASPPTAAGPLPGLVLIAPLRSTETYLVNMDKQIVHRWKSNYPPAASVYLLENGDLLRGAKDPDFTHFQGGGIGGMLERYNWNGELIWSFKYADETHCLHHDIAPLPNGNVLMIAWERKSKEEAIAQGRDPKLLKEDLWPDHVIEVQPDGPTGGKIVWEWHMWDHLVQDFDREKPNFGVVYEHPELIDVNNTGSSPPATPEELRKLRALGYTGGGDQDDDKRHDGADWLHTNAIDYHPELDQITLSAKNFSEIWIIDHSTTTAEAASHRGGKRGKGGDLLYRWGNPWSYKSGTADDKRLFDQHDVRWIPAGLPGAGHITAFNNGTGREYSSIVEIAPPLDENGDYILNDDGRFGPNELVWEYTAENKKDFYSSFISGATRLSNGNTMICEGATGRFFEVSPEGKILWQHINPFGGELEREGRPNDPEQEARRLLEGNAEKSFVENNAIFRATKYPLDYAAFAGRNVAPLPEQPVPFATLVEQAVARLKAEASTKSAADQPAADAAPDAAEGATAQPAEAAAPESATAPATGETTPAASDGSGS